MYKKKNLYQIESSRVFDNFKDLINKKVIVVYSYKTHVAFKEILVPRVKGKDKSYYEKKALNQFNCQIKNNELTKYTKKYISTKRLKLASVILGSVVLAASAATGAVFIPKLLIKENVPLTDPLTLTCLSDDGELYAICDADDIEEAPSDLPSISYSFDKKEWHEIDFSFDIQQMCDGYSAKKICQTQKDQKVYFRGDNPNGINEVANSAAFRFGTTPKTTKSGFPNLDARGVNYSISGNIMSIIDSNNYDYINSIPSDYCFELLFSGISDRYEAQFTDASELLIPASTLKDYAYYKMFYGCKTLIDAPVTLPSMELSSHCYDSMFSDCNNLLNAPTLPSTTLKESCYEAMFNKCEVMKIAPYLPASTLVTGCYKDMFEDCYLLEKLSVGFGLDSSNAWPGTSESYPYTSNWLGTLDWGDTCPDLREFRWKGPTEVTPRSDDTIPDDDFSSWDIIHID